MDRGGQRRSSVEVRAATPEPTGGAGTALMALVAKTDDPPRRGTAFARSG